MLPIAHAFAGQAVSALLSSKSDEVAIKKKNDGDNDKDGEHHDLTTSASQSRSQRCRRRAIAVAALFCLHVPAAIYLSVWHQSGALSAVDIAAEKIPAIARTKIMASSRGGSGGGGEAISAEEGGAEKLDGEADGEAVVGIRMPDGGAGEGEPEVVVHFLMPCHSAPLNSHLHFRGLETALWSLDCSPE